MRPLHQRWDRRYWKIFNDAHGAVAEAFPGVDGTGACPFAFSMQLPIRNLEVARSLEQDGGSGIAAAWFVLCVHDANPDIAGQWRKWQRILTDSSMARSLPASDVISAG